MTIKAGGMKLLLTSAGIKNPSISEALTGLLGKPISEADALCIPTAAYAMGVGPGSAWRLVNGRAATPLVECGWRSVGVLELTALPSIAQEQWVEWVREADALLVGGGDPAYLSYWMRQSGLADVLPSLSDIVWVGVSAGSKVLGPDIGEEFDWKPSAGDDSALGVVDFSVFPHLDHPDMPDFSLAAAERWAADLPVDAYAIDDQSAIVVTDGVVDVVSEGTWKHFYAAT